MRIITNWNWRSKRSLSCNGRVTWIKNKQWIGIRLLDLLLELRLFTIVHCYSPLHSLTCSAYIAIFSLFSCLYILQTKSSIHVAFKHSSQAFNIWLGVTSPFDQVLELVLDTMGVSDLFDFEAFVVLDVSGRRSKREAVWGDRCWFNEIQEWDMEHVMDVKHCCGKRELIFLKTDALDHLERMKAFPIELLGQLESGNIRGT